MPLLIRDASNRDLEEMTALLTSLGLPTSDVSEHSAEFVIAEDGGVIVASAGTEVYGTCALLRSVAVRPDYQGQGVARRLVQRLLDRARRNGVRQVYLLTTTAASYFQHLGFAPVSREQVDQGVQASQEFRELCCDSAVAMMRTLTQSGKGGDTHEER